MQKRKNVILCDFDGTITVQDTAEWILEKHATGDWRDLDDRYVRGEIELLECMQQQFALVTAEKSVILEELDRSIVIRDGIKELVDVGLVYGARTIIVSAGIDFVIEHFIRRLGLEKKVSIYSARTNEVSGRLSFQFPPLVIHESTTFKDDLVRQMRRDGFDVAYFGDGMPDTEACAISDHRFAVKGRRLEMELGKRGLAFSSFTDFNQVLPYLSGILDS